MFQQKTQTKNSVKKKLQKANSKMMNLQNTIGARDTNNGEENSGSKEMFKSGGTEDVIAVTEDSSKFVSPN